MQKPHCLWATGVLCFILILHSAPQTAADDVSNPKWNGAGGCRVLVKIPPVDIGARASDEMPARVEIDVAKLLPNITRVDVDSIQVIRYNPATGEPMPAAKFAYGKGEFDVPFRWYDSVIPDPFPEVEDYSDSHKGAFPRKAYPLWGYRYNVVGDWKRGKLAWLHRQDGKEPSYYAIYFNPFPEGKRIEQNPRCGWVGDGSNRCTADGLPTTGQIHTRIALADWNGDGLTDILAGFHSGALVVYPNLGTKTTPKFTISRLVVQDDGLPFDNGGQTAPLVVDWDGDGRQDLIVGNEWNRQLFYRNVGTSAEPKLHFDGFLKADDKILEVPHEPSPETQPQYTYTRDYYAVWEACDWDGDGDLDLLGGGYVTGRIFFYENVGKDERGLPKLHYRGPIEADGAPIDVGWAAAPCAADFDGDGDLDLISGCMLMKKGGDASAGEKFLTYWENIGTRTNPELTLRPFPKKGNFPGGILATPRAVDINGDGLLDLVVSALTPIYIWPNIGAKTKPLFDVTSGPLHTGFGGKSLPGLQMADLNGDGQLDIMQGFGYFPNLGKGNPGVYGDYIPIVKGPGEISHPSPHGDQWTYTWFADMNGDGLLDCLFGDHVGFVWFHRQLDKNGTFDIQGVKLVPTDGQPICVGVKPDEKNGFIVLQGARTTLATGDLDLDGRPDLVVCNTYGDVRYYRNAGGTPVPRFDPPVLLGNVHVPCTPCIADWDGDGRPDVFAARRNPVFLWLNKKDGDKIKWVETQPNLPEFPHGAVTLGVADFNGDGDADILATTAYGYTFFVEHSFLEHGYAEAAIIASQRR